MKRSQSHLVAAALAACLSSSLSACMAVAPFVPKDGPAGEAVRVEAQTTVDAQAAKAPYAFVALTPENVGVINDAPDAATNFGRFFAKGAGKTRVPLGVGDIVSITVFEAQAGGLFLPTDSIVRGGNFVPIPNQQIDASGQITIPYAGVVKLAGKTPEEASRMITGRLAGRAVEPQVVVGVVERHSNPITVVGDVGQSSRFFLDPGGLRLLDAIAHAGGSRHLDFETLVKVQRGGAVAQATMSAIEKRPDLNVNLQPGDTVELSYRPKVFMAFGSTNQVQEGQSYSRRFPFETEEMSLAEGLSRAGGLDDRRADPKSVFLMRLERRETLEKLGADTSAFFGSDLIPAIYSVDLSSSDGFFKMNQLQLRHMDMIVATDAPLSDATKLVSFINTMASIGYQIAYAAK